MDWTPYFVAGIGTVVPAIAGGGAWIIKLHNKVNMIEEKHSGLKELVTSRFDSIDANIADLRSLMEIVVGKKE